MFLIPPLRFIFGGTPLVSSCPTSGVFSFSRIVLRGPTPGLEVSADPGAVFLIYIDIEFIRFIPGRVGERVPLKPIGNLEILLDFQASGSHTSLVN